MLAMFVDILLFQSIKQVFSELSLSNGKTITALINKNKMAKQLQH